MTREEIMQKAFDSIVEADEDMAAEVIEEGKAEGITAVEMLQEGFSRGMNELGDQFGRGEIFLPELIFATEVMKVATDAVDEELAEGGDHRSGAADHRPRLRDGAARAPGRHAAAERADVIVWALSERERQIVESLGREG